MGKLRHFVSRRLGLHRGLLSLAAAAALCCGMVVAVAGGQGTQPDATYLTTVAADSPVAQFQLADAVGSSTIADSVGSYTATNDGVTLGGSGPFTGSVSGAFNGSSSYAVLPSSPLKSASAFTAEGWVYWAGGSSYGQAAFDFGSSSTVFMYLTPASSATNHPLTFQIEDGSSKSYLVTDTTLPSKTWEYVAVTETTAGVLTLYLNGAQVGQTTGVSISPATLGSVSDSWFGKSIAGSPYFSGSLSNVAFYTSALSTARILAHYDAGEFPVNSTAPSISGTAQDGQTLTASPGSWTGVTPLTYAYQWQQCNSSGGSCSSVTGATGTTFGLGHSNVGNELMVGVTATNSAGSGSANSAPSAVVTPLAPSDTALPAISGTAEDGQSLSVSTGTWNGTPPLTYAYQWELCNSSGGSCSNVSGATSSSYTVISSEVGETLRAVVTATNAAGNANATSNATATIVAAPPVNTALPAISGTAQQGQTLTASTGTWTGTPTITYTYQWEYCNSSGGSCSNISGATSSTYTVASTYVGDTLRVVVKGTNSAGNASATSNATGVVLPPAPVNTALPAISGTTTDGSTLTASTGTWAGSGTITYTYQWETCNTSGANCSNVSGQTSSTYLLGHSDVGTTLRVVVTATNSGGSTPATSNQTAVIAALAPSNTVAPVVSGTAQDEQTLTVSNGSWNGTPPLTYTYQWELCNSSGGSCSNIAGATSSSYTAISSEVGDTLRAAVTATNSAGNANATSAATSAITAAAPANTALPAISGTAQQGQILTASPGSWTGTPTITYTYQWENCNSSGGSCLNITGATSSSYTIATAYVGDTLRAVVTATNAAGNANATSAATAVVVAAPPVNTTAPAISGTPTDGSTLSASTGTWTGTPTITYTYQWESCNSAGASCTNITGQTASTYVLGHSDVGTTLRVVVTATNSVGTTPATSSQTAVIAALAPTNTTLPAITGTAQDEQTLTVSNGTWSGTPPLTYTYQWQLCSRTGQNCENISGATSSSFAITPGDVGGTIVATVTATNVAGNTSAASTPTADIAAAAPVNTSSPQISGTPIGGDTLTASTGTWTGTPTITYTYQWVDCTSNSCQGIPGATNQSYQLAASDIGDMVEVAVTATNAAGDATTTSQPTATVAADSPTGTLTAPLIFLTAATKLTGAASDPTTGIASWTVQIETQGGSIWQTACTSNSPIGGSDYACQLTTTEFADGTYELRALITSTLGTIYTTTPTTVTIDNSGPTATLTAPPAVVGGTVTVQGAASDQISGIASWQLQIQGPGTNGWQNACNTQTSPTSGSIYGCQVNTTQYANGSYQLQAIIVDGAGNTTTTAAVRTEIDQTWNTFAGSESDCTDVWTGSAGDDQWTTAGNWSTGNTPTGSDVACILGTGTVVQVNGTAQAAAVLAQGTVDVAAGSLSLVGSDLSTVGSLSVSGYLSSWPYTWYGAALSVAGTLDVPSSFGLSATGSIGGSGTVVLEGAASGTVWGGTLSVATFVNDGSLTVPANGSWLSVNATTLVNNGSLTVAQAGQLDGVNAATLDNAGTLSLDQGGFLSLNGGAPSLVVNTGTIAASGSGSPETFAWSLDNEGSVQAQDGGQLQLAGGDPSTGGDPPDAWFPAGGEQGSWASDATSSITFESGSYELGANVVMSGQIDVGETGTAPSVSAISLDASSADLDVAAGSLSLVGSGLSTVGSLSVSGYLSSWPYTWYGAALSVAGTLDVPSSFGLSATGSIGGSGTVVLEGAASGTVWGGTLSVATFVNDGSLTVPANGSWLSVNATTLVNNGSLTVAQAGWLGASNGASLENTGTLSVQDDATATLSGAELANEGTVTFASGSVLTVTASASVENATPGTMTATSATIDGSGGSTIQNGGSLTLQGSTTLGGDGRPVDALLVNTGSVLATGASTTIDWTIDNEGAVDVQGGQLQLVQGDPSQSGGPSDPSFPAGGEQGSWTAANGASIAFQSGSYEFGTGVSMSGQIDINGGNISAGSIDGASDVSLSDGSLSLTAASGVSTIGSLSLSGSGGLGWSEWGSLSVAGTLDVSGTFGWSEGPISGGGEVVLEGSASGEVQGWSGYGPPQSLNGTTLVNDGSLTIGSQTTQASLYGGSGSMLENDGTLTLDTGAGGAYLESSGTGLPLLLNTGSIVSSGTGDAWIYWSIDNEGTVDAQSGQIELAGGDPSTPGPLTDVGFPTTGESGSWIAAPGASIAFLGWGGGVSNTYEIYPQTDTTYQLGDNVTMSGTIDILGPTVNAGSINGPSAHIAIGDPTTGPGYGGALNFTDPTATSIVNSLELQSFHNGPLGMNYWWTGTMGGPGTVDVTGGLEWLGGIMGAPLQIVLERAATSQIDGWSADDPYADLTMPVLAGTTLINEGTLTVGGVQLDGNGGTLENASGGNLEVVASGQLMNMIPAGAPVLENLGTLTENDGGGTTYVSWPFDNDGTINQRSGTIDFTGPKIKVAPTPAEQRGGGNPAEPDLPDCQMYSVGCASGDFSQSQTDLTVSGLGGGLALTRAYDSQNAALASEPGIFGYGWTASYTDSLSINPTAGTATVYQSDGSETPFTINADGTFSAPPWVQATLAQNPDSSYTYTLPDRSTMTFNSAGQLTGEADQNGNTTSLTYNDAGQLTAITDAGNQTITLTYNSAGLVASAIDPAELTVYYTYDSNDNLVEVTDNSGLDSPRWAFGYDSSHDMTSMTDADGNTTTLTYDSPGQVATETDPMGRTTTWSYSGTPDAGSSTTSITNAAGDVTHGQFNYGEPTSVTSGYGSSNATTTSTTYNASYEPIAQTDGSNDTTTNTYDSAGNQKSTTDADGNTTTDTYNASHQVTSETSPNGETTTMVYDGDGNLLQTIQTTGTTQAYGTFIDSAGSGFLAATANGSVQAGQPGPLTGDPSHSLSVALDGSSGVLTTGSSELGDTAGDSGVTFEAWVDPTSVASGQLQDIYRKWNYGGYFRLNGDRLEAWFGNGSSELTPGLSSGTVSAGVWTLVAVTYDPSTGAVSYYIDGEPAGGGTIATDQLGGSSAVPSIGAYWTGSSAGEFFGGEIADFALYGTTLTGPEIASDYAATTQSAYAGNVLTKARDAQAYYQLDEGIASSTFADSAPNPDAAATATGSVEGDQPGPLTGDASHSLAARFDGSTGYLAAGSAAVGDTTGDSGVTIEAWIDPTSTSGVQDIYRKWTYGGIFRLNGDRLDAWIGNGGSELTPGLSSGAVPAGQWSHVAVTYNATTGGVTYYINGQPAGGGTIAPGQLGDSPDAPTIGAYWSGGGAGEFFGGEIADVAIYGTALSPSDIAQDYAATTQSAYDTLVLTPTRDAIAYYALNDTDNAAITTDTYNANGTLSSETDPDGNTTTYTYNSQGNIASETNADGDTTSYTYDADGRKTSMTTPEGNVAGANPADFTTTYTMDALGRVTATTDPLGNVTKTRYDPDGNVISTTDPDGNTTTTSYDADGEVTKITYPNGSFTQRSYTQDGQLATQTAQNGGVTSYSYDAAGNMVSETGPLNTTTSYTYDAVGQKTSMTDPDGHTTRYAYDPAEQLVTTTYPNGSTQQTTYTPDGQVATQTNQNGQVTSYTYDSLDRLTSETGPLDRTTSYTYDLAGQKTSMTDPDGYTTSYTYDPAGQLIQTTYADGSTQQKTYTPDGQVATSTDQNGHVTTYSYDADDRLTSETDPLDRTTSYTYDSAGNKTSMTDPEGRTTTYGSDDMNHLTSISYSDGSTPDVSYTYTPDGQVATMSDGTGTSTYSYDQLDRLTSTTDGADATISYGYDPDGNETSITYPNGQTVNRTFDEDGNLASVTDWLGNKTMFSYDPANNLTETLYPGSVGQSDSYTYDDANELTATTTTANGATLASINDTYDSDGNVTQESSTGLGDSTQNYTYNSLDELTGDNGASDAYDPDRNLTQLDGNSTPMTYNAADELTSGPGGTYIYNSLGERTTQTSGSTTTSYGWNQADDLTSNTGGSSDVQLSYTYNGNGLLQSATSGSTTTQLTWDPNASVPLLIVDGTTNIIYGPNSLPLEQIASDGTVLYYHHDQLGSTRMLTNASGNPVETVKYSPYGTPTVTSGASLTNLLFAGQYTDPNNGLIYLRARWYDPATGQFMSDDPAEAQTGAAYYYAGDDPTVQTDLTGLDDWLGISGLPSPGQVIHVVLYPAGLASDGITWVADTTGLTGAAQRAAEYWANLATSSHSSILEKIVAYTLGPLSELGTHANVGPTTLTLAGAGIAGAAGGASAGADEALSAVTSGDELTVAHLTQPDLIGSQGGGYDVRVLSGDAKSTFERLVQEGRGEPSNIPGYQGPRFTLANGVDIGLRTSSGSGLTIDVDPPAPLADYRIHFRS